MAYNINLHFEKTFSVSPTGVSLFNKWSFDPPQVLKSTYIIGGAIPGPINIDTFIKNYLTEQNLDNVIIRASIISESETGLVDIAALSGEIADATPAAPIDEFDKNGYEITANNLNVTTTLTFQNLDGLVEGVYGGVIQFTAYDVSPGLAKPMAIGASIYSYELLITNLIQISAVPKKLVFSLLRTGVLPNSQSFNITAPGNWLLKMDNKLEASAPNTVVNASPSQVLLSGSGNSTVTVGLTEALKLHPSNVYETVALISANGGSLVHVQIVVNILEADVLEVTPSALCFEAVKGFVEAPSQTVNIKAFGAFTINKPSWLNISTPSGTDAINLIVDPISANNLEAGTYNGEIIISTNSKTFNLPVKYIVEGVISTTLSLTDFNFTKDLDYLNIRDNARDDDNTARLTLTGKVYDYITNAETNFEYPYILPFFNYSAQIHIGEIVERLLKKASHLNAFSFNYLNANESALSHVYKPALVNLKIEIVKRSTSEVVLTENLNNIKFVAGKKPSSFKENAAILSYTAYHKRVTINSNELLNFVVPKGVYELLMKRNSEKPELLAAQNTGENNVFRFVFDFSNYSIGDEIILQLKINDTVFTKSYYIIPEEVNTWHIGYINQHHVLEIFECLGSLSLSSAIKKTTHKYYKNLIEHVETLDSTNEMKLLINTGTIFKEDQVFITELLRSKKCWLIFNDKQAIELDAVDKKLVNYDSDQELYDYELEFNINRKHDVENYTF